MASPEPGEVNPKKFNHLRKLANSDFGKFALQVEHMSAEVQMKLIAQLPEFRKLASDALDRISRAHKSTVDSMDHSEDQVHRGFEQWRSALLAMLDDPSLSLEDKLKITAEIGRTLREQADINTQNARVKAAMLGKLTVASLAVVGAVVVAVVGGKFGIDSGDDGA